MSATGTAPTASRAPASDRGSAAASDIAQRNSTRRRLRRRLLLWSVPLLLGALLAAGWLLGRSATMASALGQYDRQSYTESAGTFGGLLDQNFLEPWIPWFDRGAALASAEDYVEAIDNFERALPLVPAERRCEVVLNLSLGWERLADGYAESGFFTGATLLYQNAADVLRNETCTPPDLPVDGRDLGQALQEAEARLDAKLEASQSFAQEQDAAAPATPEEQLEQLRQQGEGAAEDKADDDARDRGERGQGGFTLQPW